MRLESEFFFNNVKRAHPFGPSHYAYSWAHGDAALCCSLHSFLFISCCTFPPLYSPVNLPHSFSCLFVLVVSRVLEIILIGFSSKKNFPKY